MTAEDIVPAGGDAAVASGHPRTSTVLVRSLGWCILAILFAYLVNDYLTNWLGWPGPASILGGKPAPGGLGWLQAALFPGMMAVAVAHVLRSSATDLREDSRRVHEFNLAIVRCAFFAVLYVGIADVIVSFMRVEDLLTPVFGQQLALDLSRNEFRGLVVHIPLIALGIATGCVFRRTLGFHWLALLVVAAELLIVITRFIFSYEQALMSDLVRFWYAALFLFSSAYTLYEEGHVRVDVFYTNFAPKKKAKVNAIGSLILGLPLNWVILGVGMDGKTGVINAPLLNFESTQTGYGAYVKYLMAAFLAILAITMIIQFVSYLMEAVADWRGDPGGREHESHGIS